MDVMEKAFVSLGYSCIHIDFDEFAVMGTRILELGFILDGSPLNEYPIVCPVIPIPDFNVPQ